MKQLFSDFKNNLILSALCSLVLGVILILFPDTSGRIICYVAAAAIALFGVAQIVGYFVTEISFENHRFYLVQGVLAVALAVFLFVRPTVLLSILPALLGVVVLIAGIVKLQSAIDLLRVHYSRWLLVLVTAVLTIVLGVVILVNPFAAAVTMMIFIGVSLVVSGLSDLFAVAALTRRIKSIQRLKDNS